MDRPRYKELYEDAKKQLTTAENRIGVLEAEVERLSKNIADERSARYKAESSSGTRRRTYTELYRKVDDWVGIIQARLLRDSVTKDDWLMIPAIPPEEATALVGHVEKIRKYLDDNKPEPYSYGVTNPAYYAGYAA